METARRLSMIVLAGIALTAAAPTSAMTGRTHTIFSPVSSDGFIAPGVMYARAVTLHHDGDANGTIVATFETYRAHQAPDFPIFKSTDGGATWVQISAVTDTVNGYGMRWNPQIYELPAQLGKFPAGTLMVAGLSVPSDYESTTILLYASTDQGKTWEYASMVAVGGYAVPLDPNTPIWEPFLLMNRGKLIVYYSDQRQNSTYSQKLVHQVSTDGIHWGPVVNDVTTGYQSGRPGMATVAQISGGRWIMTYEFCNAPGGGCPVYYKLANNPEHFGSAKRRQIVLNDGQQPGGQPYVVWTPSGGPQGTIIVSSASTNSLAVNTRGGAVGSWKAETSNGLNGYSRSLMVMPDGNTIMALTGGYHDSTTLNKVQFAFDNVAPGISQGADYTLTNTYSGLNAGVTSTSNGSAVVQLTASSSSTSQHWVLQRQPDDYFTLTNVMSGLVLAVRGASTSDGAIVEQDLASLGSSSQEWAVSQQTDGKFLIVNRKSDKPLDDYQLETTSGSEIDQSTSDGGSNQRWTLTQVALPSNLAQGLYVVQNNFGKYLEIPAGNKSSGTQADQWWYANQAWHLWKFAKRASGYWMINANSGLALTDTYPKSPSNPRITQTRTRNGNRDQLWRFVRANNKFLIKNVGTGRYITMARGASADLVLAVSRRRSTRDQSWTITRLN